MRLWSTPESVQKGESSVLAIFETLVAMAIYIGVGVHFDTWWHFTTAMLVAPFMLLRTEESVRRGWSFTEKLHQRIDAGHLSTMLRMIGILMPVLVSMAAVLVFFPSFFGEPVYYKTVQRQMIFVICSLMMGGAILYAIWPPIIGRLVGATVGFVTGPLSSVRAIPGNWWKLVACMDFARTPEIIPHPFGIEPARVSTYDEVSPLLSAGGPRRIQPMYHAWGAVAAIAAHMKDLRLRQRPPAVVFASVFSDVLRILPIVIFGIAFRLSIKGTAIIWLPLLWAARPPKPANEPWGAHLKLKATDDLTRFVVLLSTVSLALLAAKTALFIAAHELALTAQAWKSWLGEPLGEFVAAFVRPGEIPIWQLASTVNAILALTLFLLLRHWLRRAEVGLPINESWIDRTVSNLYFFRGLLSTYTIGNHLVVSVLLAQELSLPTVGSEFFPWL